MTSTPRHHGDPPSLPRTGAGVLAASIAAAAIVGLLTLIQNAPPGVQTVVPASADNASPRVEHAPKTDSTPVTAHEQ
jgi:hypothetical protein